MDKKVFAQLLHQPNEVKTLDKQELEKLINEYPWFATAHLLLTKKYQLSNSKELEQRLSYTLAFANDRQALYHLLYEVPAEMAKKEMVAEPVLKEELTLSSIAENFDQVETETEEDQVEVRNAEIEAIKKIETELVDETKLLMNEEFHLMAESGSAAELAPANSFEDEKEEDWVEDNQEPEVKAIQEMENQFIQHGLNESLKKHEVDSLSQAEYSHKQEDEEPDDERFFEEKFDTELESVKRIDLQTSELVTEKELVVEVNVPAEKKTEIPEPALIQGPVNAEERHTFSGWLTRFKLPDVKPETTSKPKVKVVEPTVSAKVPPKPVNEEPAVLEYIPDYLSADPEEDLKTIDRFVESLKEKKEVEEEKEISIQKMAIKSLLEDGPIVSETLARIYEAQGKYQKAISTYEKLSLTFPDKSVYFASLIQGLKNKL